MAEGFKDFGAVNKEDAGHAFDIAVWCTNHVSAGPCAEEAADAARI